MDRRAPGRLVVVDPTDAEPGRGLCLEPHDCMISKLVAGRPRDLAFADGLIDAGLVDLSKSLERPELLDERVAPSDRARVQAWVPKRAPDPGSATPFVRATERFSDESALVPVANRRVRRIMDACRRPLGGTCTT